MTLEDFKGAGIGIVVLTLIQLSPIKINPWTWIWSCLCSAWRAFCRSLNAEVLAELESVREAQRSNNERLTNHILIDDKREADRVRERILIFCDELCHGILHSEEMFNDILLCIDWYEDYCAEHPEYKNNRAVLATQNIKDNYAVRLRKGDFLKMEVQNEH